MKFEQKPVPPRGARGSNQAIIRAMKPAEWVVGESGEPVLIGDSILCESRPKANSFWSSARKMGLKMIRRQDGTGTRCWVLACKPVK